MQKLNWSLCVKNRSYGYPFTCLKTFGTEKDFKKQTVAGIIKERQKMRYNSDIYFATTYAAVSPGRKVSGTIIQSSGKILDILGQKTTNRGLNENKKVCTLRSDKVSDSV